jgi:hypothetical protein
MEWKSTKTRPLQMIEVFKTNVLKSNQAQIIVNLIQRAFAGYSATFDLEDCDKVLCVRSAAGHVCSEALIRLLRDFGYHAEVMCDEKQISLTELSKSVTAIYR